MVHEFLFVAKSKVTERLVRPRRCASVRHDVAKTAAPNPKKLCTVHHTNSYPLPAIFKIPSKLTHGD
eukprot:COSAG02_NODE_385_length_23394_cov_43.838807_12_plen_67_part_00